MSKRLLAQYIRLAVNEVHLARVPDQLVSADSEEGSQAEDSEEASTGVNEFSAVGGGNIMGYTGTLGQSPKAKKNKRKK
jgi:hypothetical protein